MRSMSVIAQYNSGVAEAWVDRRDAAILDVLARGIAQVAALPRCGSAYEGDG